MTQTQSSRLALTLFIAFALVLIAGPSHAQFLEEACGRLYEVYEAARNGVYIVGGIGLIVLAIFAFFGRFKWTHLFALAGGIFLVAITDQLIMWLGGDGIGGC